MSHWHSVQCDSSPLSSPVPHPAHFAPVRVAFARLVHAMHAQSRGIGSPAAIALSRTAAQVHPLGVQFISISFRSLRSLAAGKLFEKENFALFGVPQAAGIEDSPVPSEAQRHHEPARIL
jgi:hypothetical protein